MCVPKSFFFLTLKFDQNLGHAPASATCHACELSFNLWLCLECGSLGCGRAQFGGTGGNGHALQHYKDTGHSVNVKLGTITAEGSAGVSPSLEFLCCSHSSNAICNVVQTDLYCYHCDDARTDSHLQKHLSHFGIEIAKQEKTEKSMTELVNGRSQPHDP